MKRTPVVRKTDAIAIARAAVAADNSANHHGDHHIAVLDQEPSELWWAWIVPVQSVQYVATGDHQHFLFGLGPYLVDKFTGEAIPTGTGTRLHPLERARGYRAWWDFRGPNWIMKLSDR